VGAISDMPFEIVLGWTLWVVGGLLLTLWFLRRSASPRVREVGPLPPPTGAARLSGTHAVAPGPLSGTHATARPLSGTHAAARPLSGTRASTVRPSSGVHAPDTFAELRALLDPPEEPPRTR
jgi:hypothetical protein